MILHTINKVAAFALCQDLVTESDTIVLLEDGVYLGLEDLPCPTVAIRDDVEARGLTGRLIPPTETIGYDEFVRLCTMADKVCSWF